MEKERRPPLVNLHNRLKEKVINALCHSSTPATQRAARVCVQPGVRVSVSPRGQRSLRVVDSTARVRAAHACLRVCCPLTIRTSPVLARMPTILDHVLTMRNKRVRQRARVCACTCVWTGLNV